MVNSLPGHRMIHVGWVWRGGDQQVGGAAYPSIHGSLRVRVPGKRVLGKSVLEMTGAMVVDVAF